MGLLVLPHAVSKHAIGQARDDPGTQLQQAVSNV